MSDWILHEDDIRSTSMGAPGEDIQFSPAARAMYPWSVECKNVENLNIWKALEQAESNSKGHQPIVVFKKNQEEPHAAMEFEYFMELYRKARLYDEKVKDYSDF